VPTCYDLTLGRANAVRYFFTQTCEATGAAVIFGNGPFTMMGESQVLAPAPNAAAAGSRRRRAGP
jgi:hypothetical protein